VGKVVEQPAGFSLILESDSARSVVERCACDARSSLKEAGRPRRDPRGVDVGDATELDSGIVINIAQTNAGVIGKLLLRPRSQLNEARDELSSETHVPTQA
jgi:hypothetical protein